MVLYIFAALCSIADVGLLLASLFGQAWWYRGSESFGFLRLCNHQISKVLESCGFRDNLFKFEDGKSFRFLLFQLSETNRNLQYTAMCN